MLKLFQKKNGAVTVFLTLIMVPMLFVAEFAMDASRIYGAKVIVSGAGDLAMNAALTDYDKILQDMYGLFATSASEDELVTNLGKYFKQTIEGIEPTATDDYTRVVLEQIKTLLRGDPEGDLQIHNLIDLSYLGVEESSYVDGSQLYYNENVKKQIVEYMKYRGPVSIGSGLLEKIGMVVEVKKQQEVVEKKAVYDESLNAIQEILVLLGARLNYYTLESAINAAFYNNIIPLFYQNGYKELQKLMKPLVVAAVCNDGLDVPTTTGKRFENIEELEESVTLVVEAVGEEQKVTSDIFESENLVLYLEYLYKIKSEYDQIDAVINSYPLLKPKAVKKPSELSATQLELLSGEQEARYYEEWDKYYEYLGEKEHYESIKSDIETMQHYRDDLIKFRATKKENAWDVNKDDCLAYWFARLEQYRETISDQGEKYGYVCELKNAAETVIETLEALLECIDESENAGKEWNRSIEGLAESMLKQSMAQQFKEVAKGLKKEDILELKSKMEVNLNYFTTLKEAIESMKYLNEQVFVEGTSVENIYAMVLKNQDVLNIEAKDAAEAMRLVSTTNVDALCNIGDFSKLLTVEAEVDIRDTAFYKFMEDFYKKLPSEMFQSSEETIPADDKENEEANQAKSEKANIIENVNKLRKESEKTEEIKTKMPASEEESYYTDLATSLIKASADKGKDLPKVEDKDNAAQQSKNAGAGLSGFDFDKLADMLAGAAESFRDDLYITEYMTEMFSCYTTTKNPDGGDPIVVKSLSGYTIDAEHNYLFGCEQEYILWGQQGENTNRNIAYTTASIFAIRYVLNLAYAFTSPEIQASTLGIATAIAGWTVFGVPLVQTVLILAIALGETAWDILELKAGNDVVIYKSATTWRLSLTGLTKEVTDEAIDIAKKAAIDKVNETIGKTSEMIENFANETVENVEKTFNGYAEQSVDTLVDSAVAGLVTPLTSTLQMYILNQAAASEHAKDEISFQLDKLYQDMESTINSEAEGLAKEVKKWALDYFKKNMLDQVKQEFNSALTKLNTSAEETTQSIINGINDKIDGLRITLKEKVKEYTIDSNTYKSIKQSCQSKLNDYLNDAEKKTSEMASEAISSFADQMSYSLGTATGSSGGDGAVSKAEKGALFTLTYQEYVKIFILLARLGDDTKQVARMCDLIKMNLCASTKAPAEDFMWSDSYTMFNMRAKAALRTTIDYEAKKQHTPTRFIIEYNSYLGY